MTVQVAPILLSTPASGSGLGLSREAQAGLMEMPDREQQLSVVAEAIFVPAGEVESGGPHGVEEGSPIFYSPAER
jgi:hypothetical protein